MTPETANAIAAVISATIISLGTYFLSKRAGEKRSQEPKSGANEYGKNYVDDLILQLRSRIEECAARAEAAEGLAKAAKEQVDLLNLRTTDLEKQIVDLLGQIAAKKQEVTRAESERDTAIAERNTLRDQPERGGVTVDAFLEQLMNALEKRLTPATPITVTPKADDDSEIGLKEAS